MTAKASSLSGKLFCSFGLLSLLDLYLTYRLLQENGSEFYEGNPIANAWLMAYGWKGLIFFKILSVLIFFGTVAFVARHRPALGRLALTVSCAMVATVVLYSWGLANGLGNRADEEVAYNFPPVKKGHWPRHLANQEVYSVIPVSYRDTVR
jgi:hypothetical protein